jgi:hypothetical protein
MRRVGRKRQIADRMHVGKRAGTKISICEYAVHTVASNDKHQLLLENLRRVCRGSSNGGGGVHQI